LKQTSLFFDEPDPEPEPVKPMLSLSTGQQKTRNAYTQILLPEDLKRADDFTDFVKRRRATAKPLFETPNRMFSQRQSFRSELALAIRTGLPWTGGSVLYTTHDNRLPDVGDDIEVRWTERQWNGTWWLKADKRHVHLGDSRFVLATGMDVEFTFHGWAYGDEIMRDKWWDADAPYPCWSYPEHLLYPMEELL
jgi:hypothetical protein